MKEIIICPLCDETIHTSHDSPIVSRVSLPSRNNLTGMDMAQIQIAMMEEADRMHRELVVIPAEDACREHFRSRHHWRFRAWKRFGFNFLLQKRWLVA